ncbi:MAG: NAD(P)H-dependent oxidoreductase [Planctomycetota bacterium]|nr:NAD(P)H-dependent oxidoreductase [Planctomycetota bacterium]
MTSPIRVLAFAGSLRRDSWNKKLVRVAAEGARAAGAEVTVLDLRDVEMPLFDEDLERERGLPEGAKRFKQLLLAHHAILISSPEYNSSISAVLKNAIDWASRAEPGEKPLACFDGKVAGLLSASPGALGGLRGLVTVRSILGNIRVLVVPEQVAISKAHEAFDADGNLRDAKQAESVRHVGTRVAAVARALAPA